MTVTKQGDAQHFFRLILKQNNNLESLLSDYLDYHGGLDWGQLGLVHETVNKLAGGGLQRAEVIAGDSRLNPALLERYLPSRAGAYFAEGDGAALAATRVFDETANQYQSEVLPARYNQRLRQARRPALDIYRAEGRRLFVAPYGYQYFDPAEGTSWPLASSRHFSKSIMGYPQFSPERPLVVVQDQYDTGNLAHFIYDSVPRILYFIETFPHLAKSALYILGGAKSEIHRVILASIAAEHGLDAWNFFFPHDRIILTVEDSAYFFSDQRRAITHPLHMCAPETLRLVRGVLARLDIPRDTPEKIYVSRRDASLRRLRNEDALVTALAAQGYHDVTLTGMPALDQIALLANAKHVVAPHGMGLTNIVFNHGHGSLKELFNPEMGSDAYAFVATALGLDYAFHIGTSVAETKTSEYDIDIDEVMGEQPAPAPAPAPGAAPRPEPAYEEMLVQERSLYFAAMSKHAADLPALVQAFFDYDGPLYGDQVAVFYERLAALLPGDEMVAQRRVLRWDTSMDLPFLARVAPELTSRYLTPRNPPEPYSVELLPPSEFQWRDDSLPLPFDPAIHRARRGAFTAYAVKGGTVFLGPVQFQYIDEPSQTYAPAASLRGYSAQVLSHPRRRIEGDVVLIQDPRAGTNFAHFLYDWAVRILFILRSGEIAPRRATFLMGGEMGPFQTLVLEQICARHGVNMAQFLFPKGKQLIEIGERFIYFSDNVSFRLPPAQLAHPEVLALLRDLLRPFLTASGAPRRVFVSRGDARMRLLANEDALFEIAARHGFEKVRLGELPLEDQIALMRDAQYVAGAHGMGMTHLIFNTRQFALLELFHPTQWTDAYAMTTRALGGRHYFVKGEATGDNKGSYTVDPEAFARALEVMIG